jgi:hypothetical protein
MSRTSRRSVPVSSQMLAGRVSFPTSWGGAVAPGSRHEFVETRIAARKRTSENGCKTEKDAVLKNLAEGKAIFEKY